MKILPLLYSTKSFLIGFLFSEAKLPDCLDVEHFWMEINTKRALLCRGVETILKVEGHDSYEVKNGGPGVYPRKKFCKPRPSNCGKMIPRLVIMLKPNKIPPLKLYIAITFCLITLLL